MARSSISPGPASPARSAAVRLRRVDRSAPGLTRRRRGRGFEYLDARGERVTDDATLARIRGLAIPPAWTDVWICPDECGHLQAVGTDAAGRVQYRYHDRWRAHRDRRKHERMVGFAEQLPALRELVDADLRRRGMPRERVLACATRLLDRAFFRVGSESYAEQHGSFGLATIRKRHVKVRGDTITFDYVAKGGIRRVQRVGDADLAKVVRTLVQRPNGGHELLAWKETIRKEDRKGPDARAEIRWRDVRSTDINAYLKEHAGDDVSAKDFRTWHATVLAAVVLARPGAEATSRTSRRKLVPAAVRDVAGFLGNTPAVCRASYIDPQVIDRFMDGQTIGTDLAEIEADDLADPAIQQTLERAVLDLLAGDRSAPRAARAA